MRFRVISVVLALALSGFFPQATFAQDQPSGKDKKAWVSGKVYDVDKTTPLENIPIRIVNVESGEVTEEKTQEDGCYRFKGVHSGSYSLAVTYKGQDYLLPEKVLVEDLRDRDVAVAVCVAISDKDSSLILLDNCHICLGAGFPPLGVLLIGGLSSVGGVILGHNQEPVVSESRP